MWGYSILLFNVKSFMKYFITSIIFFIAIFVGLLHNSTYRKVPILLTFDYFKKTEKILNLTDLYIKDDNIEQLKDSTVLNVTINSKRLERYSLEELKEKENTIFEVLSLSINQIKNIEDIGLDLYEQDFFRERNLVLVTDIVNILDKKGFDIFLLLEKSFSYDVKENKLDNIKNLEILVQLENKIVNKNKIYKYHHKLVSEISNTIKDLSVEEISLYFSELKANDFIKLYIINTLVYDSNIIFTEPQQKEFLILNDFILNNIKIKKNISKQDEQFWNNFEFDKFRLLKFVQNYISLDLLEKIIHNKNSFEKEFLLKMENIKNKEFFMFYGFKYNLYELKILYDLSNNVNDSEKALVDEAIKYFIINFSERISVIKKQENYDEKFKLITGFPEDIDLLLWLINDFANKDEYINLSWLLIEQEKNVVYRLLNTQSIEVLKQMEKKINENEDIYNQIKGKVNYLFSTIKKRKIEIDEKSKQVINWVEEFDNN